jgi:hypothetical protein
LGFGFGLLRGAPFIVRKPRAARAEEHEEEQPESAARAAAARTINHLDERLGERDAALVPPLVPW